MRQIIYYFSVAILVFSTFVLTSCKGGGGVLPTDPVDPTNPTNPDTEKVDSMCTVTFSFRPTELPATSYPKNEIEDKMVDMNIVVFKEGVRTGVVFFKFSERETYDMKFQKDKDYEVFFVANFGSSLGEFVNPITYQSGAGFDLAYMETDSMAKDYDRWMYNDEWEYIQEHGLVMSARDSMKFYGDTDTEIVMKRRFAKVEINVTVDSLCDWEVDNIGVGNINAKPNLFSDDANNQYCYMVKTKVGYMPFQEQLVMYLPEVMGGVDSTVTSFGEYLSGYPRGTTLCAIGAKGGGAFKFPLGMDTINNYNMKGDCHYIYNVTLKGGYLMTNNLLDIIVEEGK